ncbi:MAG: hypothetical protein CSA84_02035 [Actinomycetales bacterium]|nr:MAG: hypothetical protein CSA84_02035 [Actinomycetales bacterium]
MWRDLLQPSHLIILLLLAAVLFGWKRLPDMARSLGRSMRIFKSEVSEMKSDGKTAKPSPAADDTVTGNVVPPQSSGPGDSPPTAHRPDHPRPEPQAAPHPDQA